MRTFYIYRPATKEFLRTEVWQYENGPDKNCMMKSPKYSTEIPCEEREGEIPFFSEERQEWVCYPERNTMIDDDGYVLQNHVVLPINEWPPEGQVISDILPDEEPEEFHEWRYVDGKWKQVVDREVTEDYIDQNTAGKIARWCREQGKSEEQIHFYMVEEPEEHSELIASYKQARLDFIAEGKALKERLL